MKHKIAFVIPYYGKLPRYFPLFMESIKNQPFDILFFSDLQKPKLLPENVLWKKISYSDLQKAFSRRLQIEVFLMKPYKLCDFKPLYGFLFENYLSEYDFWGSIDTDTVLGNFAHFITDEILNKIDIYSGIKEYISGSFFLIRNNHDCNSLFKKSKDWIKVIKDVRYCGFDECGGHYYRQLKEGKSIFELNTSVQSFTEIVFIEREHGLRTLFTNEIAEPKGFLPVKVDQNYIEYDGKKYLLLHFIYFKMNYYFFPKSSVLPPPYYVTAMGAFKSRPSRLRVMFSSNMIYAILKKIHINLKKLNFRN